MDRNLQIGKLYKAPWKVVLLEVDDDYIKILDSNGNIGWIWSFTNDFSGYFELVKE